MRQELRRHPFRTAGERALWTREGSFHRSSDAKKGPIRARGWRLALLDEIGDISPELQPKLLRAVQEQEFERLGSSTDDPGQRAGHRRRRIGTLQAMIREDEVPGGSLLPVERLPDRDPAVAGTA